MHLKQTFLMVLAASIAVLGQVETRWQTTHNGFTSGSCRLESNKVNITLHAFHADIEEEAVIKAEGSVGWGDPKSLELTGEFFMTPGTAVRSLLLWQGEHILKARLRDKNAADSLYESIVDRQAPQVVRRDPALIEQIGDNRYRFRIYPVSINESRRIRILYSVPLQAFSTGPAYEIKTAFVSGPANYPGEIPIEFKKAESLCNQYILAYGAMKKTIRFNATYLIPSTDLFSYSYYYYYGWYPPTAKAIYLYPDSMAQNRAYACTVPAGPAAGHYTAIFSKVPDPVKAELADIDSFGSINGSGYTLEACVTAGEKTYIADIPFQGGIGVYLKSPTAWDNIVRWTAYNNMGGIIFQYDQTLVAETDAAMTQQLPLFWGAKYSLDQGNTGLGALYGFVDSKMSLLAIEADSIPKSQNVFWEEAGVPLLLSSEIIIATANMPHAPVNNAMFEIQTPTVPFSKVEVVADNTNVDKLQVLPNGFVMLQLKDKSICTAEAALYDIRGRLISKWKLNNIHGGQIQFSLPAGLHGRFVLRVRAGNANLVSKVIMP